MEKQPACTCRTQFSVLVVDPHAGVRSGLGQRLRHAPSVLWVEESATLDDAKRIIGGVRPDVVLLDPGGWQGDWRTQLRALAALRPGGVVIALHVARPHDGYASEARALGADCVLLKGLKTEELVESLAQQVGSRAE